MEGLSVEKYLKQLRAYDLQINNTSSIELKGIFRNILTHTGDEIPICLNKSGDDVLPIIPPSILQTKRNLRSILKAPYNLHGRSRGLNIAGIRTKEDTFYVGRNVIFDSECTPLFLPVIKFGFGGIMGFNIYFHSKVVEQNTFITKALFMQFIPTIMGMTKYFTSTSLGYDSNYTPLKPNIIIGDLSDFYKKPVLVSPSKALTFDFGHLVEQGLDMGL